MPRPIRLPALRAGETLSAVSHQCCGSVKNSVGSVTYLNLGGKLITYGIRPDTDPQFSGRWKKYFIK
jgi:hypothetical protein